MNALKSPASVSASSGALRLSRTAKAITELFRTSAQNRSFSPYEIYCVLAHIEPRPSLSSIYRNLRALTDRGYLTEIFLPSGNEYVLLNQEISGVAQLRCSACNQIEERHISPVLIGSIAKSFAADTPEKIQLELIVVCQNCSNYGKVSNLEVSQ